MLLHELKEFTIRDISCSYGTVHITMRVIVFDGVWPIRTNICMYYEVAITKTIVPSIILYWSHFFVVSKMNRGYIGSPVCGSTKVVTIHLDTIENMSGSQDYCMTWISTIAFFPSFIWIQSVAPWSLIVSFPTFIVLPTSVSILVSMWCLCIPELTFEVWNCCITSTLIMYHS